MALIRRIVLGFLLLAVLAGAAYLMVPNSRYHLKRFVKGNEWLYGLSRSVLQIKYNLAAWVKGEEKGRRHPAPDLDSDRREWRLVFDASRPTGRIERFWGSIGFESFKSGLLSGAGRQLLELMRDTNERVGAAGFSERAFRYIRGHNLYSNGQPPWGEGCDIYQVDERGRVHYNWEIADKVFDLIVQNGFKPIVEFGFMPDALASIPERRQKWGRANISPPRDYEEWARLVAATVRHLCQRYGVEEVRTWYFEVWNEPDLGYLFWIENPDPRRQPSGDMQEYFKLYDYTVTAAKSACPEVRVGGPATAGGALDMLLEHVLLGRKAVNGGVPVAVDFLSTHAYGQLRPDWNNRKSKGVLRAIKWKLDRALKHDHERIRQIARRTPLLLTETGPRSESHRFNNTRFAAAWLVKLIDGVYALAEREGPAYRPREIVYWGSEQAVRQFENRKGIAAALKGPRGTVVYKRPIFNAFEALGYFSGQRMELTFGPDFGSALRGLASLDGDRAAVLVYHLNERDRDNALGDSVQVELQVDNLPFQKFRVAWYLIDETHSNVYTAWKSLGKPKRVTRRQHRELDARDDLALAARPWVETAADGRFYKKFKMQNNSVSLFLLKRLQ